ncbi:MAG: hypothetical protein Q8830_01105 [Candidatus Phytoplasma australasiaticum]|nr:hypothetical protein [Candidatus Phytoplasma australasiaticum]
MLHEFYYFYLVGLIVFLLIYIFVFIIILVHFLLIRRTFNLKKINKIF